MPVSLYFNCRIAYKFILLSFICIFLAGAQGFADDGVYPARVEIIEKGQASYDSPENCMAAIKSAFRLNDIEWANDTLTVDSREELFRLLNNAGMDIAILMETIPVKISSYIIEKFEYEDAVVLVVEDHIEDGSVQTGPVAFVLENGKWKKTNKFSGDESMHQYLDYIAPEEMLTATINLTPNHWNIKRFESIKDKRNTEKWESHKRFQSYLNNQSVLCLITSLQDDQGTNLDINNIVPKSILLNHIVLPQTWKNHNGNTRAVIIDDISEKKLIEIKGHEPLQRAKPFLSNHQGPVMIVKFNEYESIATLSDASPGPEKAISISGKLKDGRRFDSKANVHIIGWLEKHR